MDPNATLDSILKMCQGWEEWGDSEYSPEETLDSLVEHVLSLHEWISNGGFLPDLWR